MAFIICIVAAYLIFVGLVLISISKNNEINFFDEYSAEEKTEEKEGGENGNK